MIVILMIVCIFCNFIQSYFKKGISEKNLPFNTYNFILVLMALLFFVFTANNYQFKTTLLPHSIAFGISYFSATSAMIYALACGSFALTGLVFSYSLSIPALYGIIFLNEKLSTTIILGFLCLVLSIYLSCGKIEKSTVIITKKWVILTLIGFIGNGMCSVIQKMQQIAFAGNYKHEFMILALLISTILLFILALCTERKEMFKIVRISGLNATLCGISNGITNLLVMILTTVISTSVFFPIVSAGTIVLTFIASVIKFRERFSIRQYIGFGFGILSLIFLNI